MAAIGRTYAILKPASPDCSFKSNHQQMKQSVLASLPLAALVLMNSGCASLFSHESAVTKSRWQDFQSVQTDYEKIIPGQTTAEDLKKLGFDPYITPDIHVLN